MIRTPRSRAWLAGLVLAAIAFVWWWRRDDGPAPAPARAPTAGPTAPAAPPPPQVVPALDLAALHAATDDPAQIESYLAAFEAANRYPPTTLRLVAGMDDVLAPDRYPASDVPVPGARNLYTRPSHRLYYRFEADRGRVVGTTPIELRLTVFRGDRTRTPVDARPEPVEVHRLHASGQRTRLGTVVLSPAGPGVHVARYQPPARRDATDDDVLELAVTWSLADGGKPVHDRVLVQHTASPPARFTGQLVDRVDAGSLHVDVELDSHRAGAAQLRANLLAADGTPVAHALTTATLTPGRTWVTLTFYGLALHDAGRPGPYVVTTLRGHFPATDSAGRGAELAGGDVRHTTAPYDLSVFTSAVWDSPAKRAGLAAYHAELARLRAEPGE